MQTPQGRPTWMQTPLGRLPGQTPLNADPLDGDTPNADHPLGRPTVDADPPGQIPLDADPLGRPPSDADHPTWTEGMTHACEIVTFPQLLLRTVKIEKWKMIQ